MVEDVKLEFKGFKPDDRINGLIAEFSERIYLDAPSDSFIKLSIEKSKNKIHATCKVVSQSATFIANAINDNAIQILQQIEDEIQKQIGHWKKHRFEQSAFEKSVTRECYLGV